MASLTDKTASDLSSVLSSVKYPAYKKELLEEAERRNTSADVIAAINDMSGDRFLSMAEILNDYER